MKIKCPDCSTSYEIKTEALGPEGRSVKCAKCGSRWFVSPEEEAGTLDFEAADDDAVGAAVPDEGGTAKDEADWAVDAISDTAEAGDKPAPLDEEEDEPEQPVPPPPPAGKDKTKVADKQDAKAAAENAKDIETLAKRPKIIVNPDKFRRNHIGAILNWVMKRNFRRIGGLALFGVAVAACAGFVLMRDNIVKQSPDLASLFQLIGFEVNLRGLEFRNLRTFTEVEEGKHVLVVEGSIRNLLDETNTVPAIRLAIRGADLQEVYAWTVEPRTKSLNALDETRFRTILADPPGDASDIQVRFVERGKRQIVLE